MQLKFFCLNILLLLTTLVSQAHSNNFLCDQHPIIENDPHKFCYKGQCYCRPNYKKEIIDHSWDDNFQKCFCKQFFCAKDNECRTYDLNRQCEEGLCTCRQGYEPSGSDTDGQLCQKRSSTGVTNEPDRTSQSHPTDPTVPTDKPDQTNNPDNGHNLTLIISLPLVTLIIISAIAGYCWWKRKLTKSGKNAQLSLPTQQIIYPDRPVVTNLQHSTSNVHIHNITALGNVPAIPQRDPSPYISIVDDTSSGYNTDFYELVGTREVQDNFNQDNFRNRRNDQTYHEISN